MIGGLILGSRARPARRAASPAARTMVRAVLATLAGAAVTAAASPPPALAAQPPGVSAAAHSRLPATGQHAAAVRMSAGAPWTRIAPGGYHTCGIRAGGTLWCWGYNADGQLGTGSHTSQDQPRQVTTPAPGGWASVTAAGMDGTSGDVGEHTCAIRVNGTLWCWGYNADGQLGTGSHTSQDQPRQVTTPAPGGWARVTASSDHTCATRTSGTLWCWGLNGHGQLGISHCRCEADPDRPRQVTTPAARGWARVTAGYLHTCATRAGGSLWCWGENGYGQLGIGSHTGQDLPRQVTTPAARGWTRVTAGGVQTCAIRPGGTLWCWGDNEAGELGIGSHTSQDLPRQVTTPAPGGWARVTAGYSHTCATRTSGTLWCWGWNLQGQLGLGFSGNPFPQESPDQPQQVTTPAPGGWARVTAGFLDSCATRTGGTMWCWGANSFGRLGTGNGLDQDRPRQVTD